MEQDRYEPHSAASSLRDIAAAWLLLVLLLVGGMVSVALDHYVTVSAEPVSTYEAAVKAAAAAADDQDAWDHREPHDADEPPARYLPRR